MQQHVAESKRIGQQAKTAQETQVKTTMLKAAMDTSLIKSIVRKTVTVLKQPYEL